jgi:hypothetical protein
MIRLRVHAKSKTKFIKPLPLVRIQTKKSKTVRADAVLSHLPTGD